MVEAYTPLLEVTAGQGARVSIVAEHVLRARYTETREFIAAVFGACKTITADNGLPSADPTHAKVGEGARGSVFTGQRVGYMRAALPKDTSVLCAWIGVVTGAFIAKVNTSAEWVAGV